MRKAVVLFMAMLFCGGLSVYAEARPIHIVQKPSDGSNKKGRSLVILPTASIDGQVLTIEFTEATASQVTVKGQSTQVVVYNGAFTSEQVVITLPSLPEGDYCLEIEQGDYVYIGEFEIAV